MTVTQTRAYGQRAVPVSTACGLGGGHQLIGDFGHGTDHDHRVLAPGQPSLHNLGGAVDRRVIFHRSAAKLHHHRLHAGTATWSRLAAGASLPCAARNSPFNTAAPAPPRIVLCDRTVNFQSNSEHGRRRPTVADMPLPRMRSNRGCGRSSATLHSTGWSGAVGSA